MSRIKLTLPESLPYSTSIVVQIGDINYGNHLANDALLRLTHEARLRWLANGGFSELDVGGCGLIMADVAIEYLAQAFYGDVLVFEMGVGERTRAGFALYYSIKRQSDAQPIAKVKTGMVFFDYHTQKVCACPDNFALYLG